MRVISTKNKTVMNAFDVPEGAVISEQGNAVSWEGNRIETVKGEKLAFADFSVGAGFILVNGEWVPPVQQIPIEDARALKVKEIDAKTSSILNAGYPVAVNKHVGLDGETRADMGAMATTAAIALLGKTEWPTSYSRGWIVKENTRVSLETPQDGIDLAAAVGDFYAKVRQHSRDLKDAAVAANSKSELENIQINEGWPE